MREVPQACKSWLYYIEWFGFNPVFLYERKHDKNLDVVLPRGQKATALVPTFCGRDYSRDVVPLSLAVREANRRN